MLQAFVLFRICIYVTYITSLLHYKVSFRIVSIHNKSLFLRFKAVTQSYYNGADGVILMYDVTQELSFLSIREWIDCIKETTGSVPPSLLLLGNKLDKVKMSSSRGVSFESGETMAKIFGAQFLEVSACTGQNIAEAFFTIARSATSAIDKVYIRQIR